VGEENQVESTTAAARDGVAALVDALGDGVPAIADTVGVARPVGEALERGEPTAREVPVQPARITGATRNSRARRRGQIQDEV
jgi:hypothetical protein